VPTIILAGKVKTEKKNLNLDGPFGIYSINPKNMNLSEAMKKTNELIIGKLLTVLSNFKNSKSFL